LVLFFVVLVVFPFSLTFAQSTSGQSNCYCRLPCNSMVRPDIMDCRLFDEQPRSHPYKCPGLCKESPSITNESYCGWCGDKCTFINNTTICPLIISQEQQYYDCKLVGNECQAVPKDPSYPPYSSCRKAGGSCIPVGLQCHGEELRGNLCPDQLICCKVGTPSPPPINNTTKPCIRPFVGRPTFIPIDKECPPSPLPRSIVGFGLGILKDFSDFVYLRIGIVPRGFSGQEIQGYLWVDDNKYELRNITWNKEYLWGDPRIVLTNITGNVTLYEETYVLTAYIYNGTTNIGNIVLKLNQKQVRRNPSIIIYRDIIVGDMSLLDVDYKIYIIGRSYEVPFPIIPMR
ncbi:MAG: hypothetical protein QXU40_04365, partial [Candidatus Pacearchaeota archaeon]